jgi:hypothetical protein
MGWNIVQIIVCYIVGLLAGTLIWASYFGAPGIGFVFAFAGAFVGLPILLVAVVIFVVLCKSVLRNLSLWCMSAPFIVVVLWLTLEWELNYSNRGHDIYWYLSLRNVWERAGLAFTCASISSTLFWYWNRDQTRVAKRTGTSLDKQDRRAS